MAYAVIDRREWKVVEMSSAKKNLTAKGLIVDVDHLDRCPPTELVAAYRGLVGNRGIRRPTKAVMAKLAEGLLRRPAKPWRRISRARKARLPRSIICATNSPASPGKKSSPPVWLKGSTHIRRVRKDRKSTRLNSSH